MPKYTRLSGMPSFCPRRNWTSIFCMNTVTEGNSVTENVVNTVNLLSRYDMFLQKRYDVK